MVLESEFIEQTIFGGFVSKVVNNVWDISWEAIKKADKNRKGKNLSIQTRIYQIIIDVLNLLTDNQYKGKDIIYDSAEKLIKEFKSSSNYNYVIQHGLKNLFLNIDGSICQEFIRLLCHELGEEKNFDLYKEILLLFVNEKSNHTNEELQQIQSKLDYVIQKLNEKNIDTKDIKTEENHQLQSRTQEYAKKWDANMFLNDFDKRDENAGVNIKLSEVYLEEHLPHYIWGENKTPSKDLKLLLTEYIYEKKENQMLLILGQPGIGKSTLITWITANFTDKADDIMVYKFASDLKKIDWKNDRISERILEKLGFTYDNLNGKTLILDGYDEISISEKRKHILDCLYSDLIYSKKIKKFSLIITCRVNYIEEIVRVRYQYITLQSWNEGQIKNFCKIFQEKTKNFTSENTIGKILENKEILGIPLILYMTLALNISIEQEGSIVDIYDKIFSLKGGIYDRCITNKYFADEHRIGEIKVLLHEISRQIAFWIFENNPDEAYIPQEEYIKICEMKKDVYEKIDQDFLIGNYFKLVKHCEGIESKELYFVHRSIYEYFVSTIIFNAVEECAIKFTENTQKELAGKIVIYIKKGFITYTIGKFLYYKIKKFYEELDDNQKRRFYQWLVMTFNKLMGKGMFYYTNGRIKQFVNILSHEIICFKNFKCILRHLLPFSQYNYIMGDKCDLNLTRYIRFYLVESELKHDKVDLRNMYLFKFNLNGLNLYNADFQESYLVEADFRGSSLIGANLRKADLRKADFRNANLLRANFSKANLRNANFIGAKEINIKDIIEADLTYAIFDETQIEYLNGYRSLQEINVYIRITEKIVSYSEYCEIKKEMTIS